MLDLPAAGLAGVPVGSIEEKRASLGRVLTAVKYLEPAQRAEAAAQIARAAGEPLPDDLMMTSGRTAGARVPPAWASAATPSTTRS